MISNNDIHFINAHAYLPEHVTDYGKIMSNGEPYFFDSYLCYKTKTTLIFIGYPLEGTFDKKNASSILGKALKAFRPEKIAVIAPVAGLYDGAQQDCASDRYYRIKVADRVIPQKVRNMLRRASREVSIENTTILNDEHKRLISLFLDGHKVDNETEHIFRMMPVYVSASKTSCVIEARDVNGRLIAFDVAEFAAEKYAFYMFNVVDYRYNLPGVSDLLLSEIINLAEKKGKDYVNLGLGINSGVSFFKEKWGGEAFLTYEYCLYQTKKQGIMDLLLQRL